MCVIRNDESLKFPRSFIKNDNGLRGKNIMGTKIYYWIPSYKAIVERIIEGFAFYSDLQNYGWLKKKRGNQVEYYDPIEKVWVQSGDLLLKIRTRAGGRSNQIRMLIWDNAGCNEIQWAGKMDGGGLTVFSTYADALKVMQDAEAEGENLISSPITPSKEGIKKGQRDLVLAVA